MKQEDLDRLIYRPVCSTNEIERILDIKTADDYLLKFRADIIVDNMRLMRVVMNARRAHPNNWSLNKYFSNNNFENVIKKLPSNLRDKCNQITFGNIFSTDPNGILLKSEFGPISTLCNSLYYFLKFMHLGLLDLDDKVPFDIRMNAFRIAIRVMLKTEALDFTMDPRGIIPKSILDKIEEPIPYQLEFIAGHELGHFILDHLSSTKSSKKSVLRSVNKDEPDYKLSKVYNISQKHEFEADLASLNLPEFSYDEQKIRTSAALIWFACLDIFEAVRDTIYPPMGYQTHPPARDRYLNIIENSSLYKEFDTNYWKEQLIEMIDFFRNKFIEEVTLNIDSYEMYGSAYLAAPNTLWRGPELIDREDYY
ncbi:hypothetical protein [Gracilimonas sp. BCB1]|uniref:hypothetical protein n=1 Tax=Gracilimonas sp. BCB1 TaxID=3152362 RepID=UPI0032D97945